MDLVLIRHGRPVRIDNADGPADPALTELGHKQAKAMAASLADEHFDALYVSPMLRARETSAPLEQAFGMEAAVVPGVQEFDASDNRYIPIEDLKADKERWRAFIESERTSDRSQFSDLVISSIEDLIGRHRSQTIGIVCHGGVINMWAAKVLGRELEMFFEPEYTSINRFAASSSGHRSLVSLNETAHLKGLG